MAVISTNFSKSVLPISLATAPGRVTSSTRFCCSNSTSMDPGKAKFLEFPYASGPTKKLMVELFAAVEEQLGSSLHPHSTLPSHAQNFGNSTDTARASLHIRSGLPTSQIDFILGGWIHSKLPSGGTLNITSLSAYLASSTDAPHFLIELIQSSPTSLVLVLDLTPRKDLVLYPDYLNNFYEDTQMDRHRQRLHMLPEVKPYFSPSLSLRALLSPTAILVTVESASVEQIVEDHISPVAKDVLQLWIKSCASSLREMEEASEKACVAERDRIIKSKTIEIDIGSSFPRLFGQETSDKVLNALREYYK